MKTRVLCKFYLWETVIKPCIQQEHSEDNSAVTSNLQGKTSSVGAVGDACILCTSAGPSGYPLYWTLSLILEQ